MSDLFVKIISWLCVLGGCATGIYAIYALMAGKVIVESRGAGQSIYELTQQPGPFYGFIAFYFVCAAVSIVLGIVAKRLK